MNDIDVRRFVNVDIVQHVETQISGSRDTLVLYTHEGTKGRISGNTTDVITDAEKLASWTAANKIYNSSAFPDTNKYLSMYFNNAGARVIVIEGYNYSDVTADIIKALPNELIMVAICAAEADADAAYKAVKALCTARSNDQDVYGINEKIFFGRSTGRDDTDVVENLCAKYSNVYGAEMTMAAYVSGIDVYGVNTVNDYMYTSEVIDEEVLTDDEYEQVSLNNLNVDTYLAGGVRNLGGNLKNGADFVNSFVRIILHQTLTDRLLELLVTKLKNYNGVGRIYSTICKELENYRGCGYLSTDKSWTDETLKVTVNGVSYDIIEKGTALINGYHVKVLPLNALTDAQKAAHQAPPVYVIIADQYGIRSITVNGEII